MAKSKHIDKICIVIICITLALTLVFMCGKTIGISVSAQTMPYESTLFDTSRVHTLDIIMDDFDTFIENCEDEEYVPCTVVIDGESYKNVALRAKGNTSLSSVRSLGSTRYSFKIEFDHYESGKSCGGLDKLCLNNLIQDNTMMKDYITYRMMYDFGVDAPLCSFVYVTVNGEDFGLYLAVEGIEDSFLERNYGADAGELYKPDSTGFGGGRGNGRDFDPDDFDFDRERTGEGDFPQGGGQGDFPQGGGQGGFPQGGGQGDFPQGGGQGGGMQGMGSDDVKLKYVDDDPDSYSNIFDNAKSDVTSADKQRLISSLKNLSEYADLENTVDIDEVMRYFVVHSFVCNGDSYTGNMIHNYYLYEEDGKLSMIPWDYNLAFGAFGGGEAQSIVNSSIDGLYSGGDVDDRPMLGWIFSSDGYTEKYHALYEEFIARLFSDGELEALISETAEMISPYVESDPTKFCTAQEFETAVSSLEAFVALRGEAVRRQLSGDDTAVETGSLNLSDMGSMGAGRGGEQGGDFPQGGDIPQGGESQRGDPGTTGGDTVTESDPTVIYVLLGISATALIAGIIVVIKKKI